MQAELIDFCQAKGDYTENRQIAERRSASVARQWALTLTVWYSLDELVRGNDILFSATGVTGGELVKRYPTDGEWGADADITDRRRGPNV
ncbi:putative sugar-bisphosphatase [Escherichia coli]|uniref:Putative sugar-bisphosphatase n=1 Tax=Escherichia coli TaxID=562 RepID=A0A376ZNN4_ECOLX|nr:putative sugar-bisphosphatase [Escherichia coli]